MAASSTVTANKGLLDLFWPSLIKDDQINHQGMVRRIETILGLMIPGMAAFYATLECCHCPHSGMITLLCSIPVPTILATVDEYRADSAFAKIEALRKETLPSSQLPPPQPTMSSASTAPRSILRTSSGLGKTPSISCDGSAARRRVVMDESSSAGDHAYARRYSHMSSPELTYHQS